MTKKEKLLERVKTFDISRLEQAFREGRLYIEQSSVSVDTTRDNVLRCVSSILPYASDNPLVISIWHCLLATDERVRSFRYRHKARQDEVNPCRIAACVHLMLQMELYTGNDCNLRVLCRLLFPDQDWDSIRRNCTNYLRKEDYQIITNLKNNYQNVSDNQ